MSMRHVVSRNEKGGFAMRPRKDYEKEVLDALETFNGLASTTMLSLVTGLPYPTLYKVLRHLIDEGRVRRVAKGKYALNVFHPPQSRGAE